MTASSLLQHLTDKQSLHELHSDLIKYLHDFRARIDFVYWKHQWHEWKSTIGGTLGTLALAYLVLRGTNALSTSLKRSRLRYAIEDSDRRRRDNLDHLRRKLELSSTAEVVSRRKEIVMMRFEHLRMRLQNGTLTAVEVLEAYQWRAYEAHAQTNCVVEFLPEALEWANALDTRYSNSQEVKPPLFGIPLSLSESIALSGHDSTLGFVTSLDEPSRADAVVIQALKRLGAVPFVITNVSHGLLSVGCSNPIYGQTTNPYDPGRSAGGSSGGEAALVALRGSPLGVGVDDPGGGLRTPAHWCGVWALKPTSSRLSSVGRRSLGSSRCSPLLPIGPIGPNVDSIAWFMRTVCNQSSGMSELDPFTVPIPFDEQLLTDTRQLTIGYYLTDGLLSPVAACSRAMDVARKILESKDHRLIQITLPFDHEEMKEMMAAYASIMIPDGGASLSDLFESNLSEEPMSSLLQFLVTQKKSKLAKRFGSTRFKKLFTAFSKSVTDQEAVWNKIHEWRSKFVGFCQERNLDCIICPASATTPLPNGVPEKMFFSLWWYNALYNLLDCPVGVMRCTNVTSADEATAATEIDTIEDDWVAKELKKAAEGTSGWRVGVQCVAMPFREEVCLRVMKIVESSARV